MTTRYTTRNLTRDQEPRDGQSLSAARARLMLKMPRTGSGPWELEYEGRLHQPRTLFDAVRRSARLLKEGATDRVVLHPRRGDRWAFKRYELPDRPPVSDTPATDPVDRVVGYIREWCAERDWRITDLGFYADKPGEHGVVPPNAWDAGCLRDSRGNMLPADEIHKRNLAVATELRRVGRLHDLGREGGLPVNGVITLDVFWETGQSETWRGYGGTFHSTHWHVSGKPSQTGWI